ncbi:hypothetical protein BW730_12700 [Tessaracoccus aquimaris]|uniref:DUF7824 domain-containing protein n=1 Tax=Tessaracoccus aquimaris TaxID=1332264 RepID=A0A1Q2CQ65_9ACTN|nr:DUF6493 family protein [Tessaracoccus aquimaris]AQP48234.1 hypothetical protein BW730_12700 [Tessaracoccus aquimaris]
MRLTAELAAAYAVFLELGWAGADRADVESLPLGTPEQRAVAKRGLAKGEWGEYGYRGWQSAVDDNDDLLGYFAVRVGVPASRAVQVLPVADRELAIRLVAERGEDFASAYCRARGRRWDALPAIVSLVARLGLPLPPDRDYLEQWAANAAMVLDPAMLPDPNGDLPPRPDVEARFAEHLEAALTTGISADGRWDDLLGWAVTDGLVPRDRGLEAAFAGLDAATRQVDRRMWLRALEALAVTDEELVARADLLVSAMSHGEGPLIERFAPVLIARADDAVLGDVLAVTLGTTIKKAARAVLRAAAERPRPSEETIDVAAALLPLHLTSSDAAVAKAASTLADAWGIGVHNETADDVEVGGLWTQPPPLWEVPRFAVPEPTPQALTEAAARLLRRPAFAEDVEADRFLALANEVARLDPAAARDALAGVGDSLVPGLLAIGAWRSGTPVTDVRRLGVDTPGARREVEVVGRLGALPIPLSTPTWEDLRIDPADLLARLRRYRDEGVAPGRADLALALTRLDVTLVSKAVRDDLWATTVRVAGTHESAGRLAADYLDAPFEEPGLIPDREDDRYKTAPTRAPQAIATLGMGLRSGLAGHSEFTGYVLPTWGDAAAMNITNWGSASLGVEARQAVRRARPLTPGLAVNILGIQRGLNPAAVSDASATVREAWDRGLLQPGVADVALLDWSVVPTGLASFATVCVDLAHDGMLAVVWPLLDDLLAASLRQPRLLAGSADVVEAVTALLPHVAAAVDEGAALAAALDLPAVRALAERPGSSRATKLARGVLAALPTPTVTHAAEAPVAQVAPVVEVAPEPLERIWAEPADVRPIEDGVEFVARQGDGTWDQQLICTLPDGTRFRWRGVSQYDLATGWLSVYSIEGERTARHPDLWLWLTPKDGALWVEPITVIDGLPVADGRRKHKVKQATVATAAALIQTCNGLGLGPEHSYGLSDDTAFTSGVLTWQGVDAAARSLLADEEFNPRGIAVFVRRVPTSLQRLWPVLAEATRVAASAAKLPAWLNPVLDTLGHYAPHLRKAAARGWTPPVDQAWEGVAALAARKGSTKALQKARDLWASLTAP